MISPRMYFAPSLPSAPSPRKRHNSRQRPHGNSCPMRADGRLANTYADPSLYPPQLPRSRRLRHRRRERQKMTGPRKPPSLFTSSRAKPACSSWPASTSGASMSIKTHPHVIAQGGHTETPASQAASAASAHARAPCGIRLRPSPQPRQPPQS